MATPISNPNALKALLILHKAMLAGQVIFALISFYIVYTGLFTPGLFYLNQVLQVAAIAIIAGGLYIGNLLFKKKLSRAREMEKAVKEKFELYRSACLLQWALIEGPCLFVIICFLLTANYAFLTLAVVLILAFAMMAPSMVKIVFYLKLTEEEIAEL
jgi:hypothetical protein